MLFCLLAGTDVHHKTIKIIGMGRIGQAVAKRASGFGSASVETRMKMEKLSSRNIANVLRPESIVNEEILDSL